MTTCFSLSACSVPAVVVVVVAVGRINSFGRFVGKRNALWECIMHGRMWRMRDIANIRFVNSKRLFGIIVGERSFTARARNQHIFEKCCNCFQEFWIFGFQLGNDFASKHWAKLEIWLSPHAKEFVSMSLNTKADEIWATSQRNQPSSERNKQQRLRRQMPNKFTFPTQFLAAFFNVCFFFCLDI